MKILAYHHVCDSWIPSIARTTRRQFSRQLSLLRETGRPVLTLSRALSQLKIENQSEAEPVVITFDDGLNCFWHNALPDLLEHNYRSVIFVVTGFVGQKNHWDYYGRFNHCHHLSWRELRQLIKEGFEIGSHTHTHRGLTSCSRRQIRFELSYSKKLLEDKLGVPIHYLSYPFGRFNKIVKRIVEEEGYRAALSMNPQISQSERFSLPRTAVYLFETRNSFENKLNGNGNPFWLKAINSFSIGTEILVNFRFGKNLS